MKCELIKCDSMDDWWIIERLEHDGREWLAPIAGYDDNMMGYMKSARPSDACIEGAAHEMLAIAEAINAEESISFKRCAARIEDGKYFLCSPRNSQVPAELTIEEAKELAVDIRAKLRDWVGTE